jgi:hypothetical protein
MARGPFFEMRTKRAEAFWFSPRIGGRPDLYYCGAMTQLRPRFRAPAGLVGKSERGPAVGRWRRNVGDAERGTEVFRQQGRAEESPLLLGEAGDCAVERVTQ